MQALVEASGDWNRDARHLALRTLASFLPLVEEQVTGYANLLLPALSRVLAGDEADVVRAAQAAARLPERWVRGDVLLELALPALRAAGVTAAKLGMLQVLTHLFAGHTGHSWHAALAPRARGGGARVP